MRYVLFCLTTLFMVTQAWAGSQISRADWLNDAGTGQFITQVNGERQAAILLGTHFDVNVTGPIAEVTVTQRFKNQAQQFVAGTYVFPLPENAAIHGMEMIIGKRHISGEIHKKKVAKKIYQKAKQAGKRAGLVEQVRPNIFTTSVANIAPGETIKITLHYLQVLDRDNSRFTLRLPMTITPRYAPDNPESYRFAAHQHDALPTSIQQTAAATRQMPDEQLRASVMIHLHPGLAASEPTSTTHQLSVVRHGKSYQVTLAGGSVPMDSNFAMSWTLLPQAGVAANFMTQTIDGQHYGLLMMMPPQPSSQHPDISREQLLVIDHSGSMSGARMRQARKGAVFALQHLTANDYFNVIVFNHDQRLLFPQPVKADDAHLRQAIHFVKNLQAGGGTRVMPALKLAFDQRHQAGTLRQIIFMTDAAVSNGAAILQLEHQRIGKARLFAVGIGGAVNSFLIRRMGEYGNGSSVTIRNAKDVVPEMRRLVSRIAHPAITDLQLQLPVDIDATLTPKQLPDLYLGEPLIVAMRLSHIPHQLVLTGKNPEPWKRVLHTDADKKRQGIARLWARNRIKDLMDQLIQGADESQIKPRITRIALQHQLISKYTSFVAVEQTPVRDTDQPLKDEKVQSRLPKDMQTSARGFPNTGLTTGLQFQLALILALLAVLIFLVGRRKQYASH